MSDYVPPEVVTEILKRLPVKSLLRFRCVCKDWCSVISSPNFTTKHLSHSSASLSTPTLVRHYSKLHSKEIYTLFPNNNDCFDLDNSTRITFPFHEKSKFYFRIVGYCNGLLCLSDDLFGCRDTIIIWNPSIKRAITLPTPRVIFDRYGPYMFALGFGFDSENNDYKVVRVAYLLPDDKPRHVIPPRVEVYSISSGIWRRVKNNVESYITEHFWSQAVSHGSVHWVAYKMTRNKNINSVLRFDLHNEKFDELGLPKELSSVLPVTIFATMVKECFAILHTDNLIKEFVNDISYGCAIWVMMDYGHVDSWTKILSIRLENTGLWRMLDVKSGEFVFTSGNGELVSYNFNSRAVTGFGIFGTKYSFYVDKYVESLVLMGKGREVRGKEPEIDYEDEDEQVEDAEYRHNMISFTFVTSIVRP